LFDTERVRSVYSLQSLSAVRARLKRWRMTALLIHARFSCVSTDWLTGISQPRIETCTHLIFLFHALIHKLHKMTTKKRW